MDVDMLEQQLRGVSIRDSKEGTPGPLSSDVHEKVLKKSFGNYIVRFYQSGDEQGINQLFNLVFNQSRSLENWFWKFGRADGEGRLITVAEVEGTIVGTYAALSCAFTIGGRSVAAFQIADNCVHPDYRSFLIQWKMKKLIAEEAARRGYYFGFGFPNERAYKIGRKLKYTPFGDIPLLRKKLSIKSYLILTRLGNAAWWLGHFLSSFRDREVQVCEVKVFDSRVDQFWSQVLRYYNAIQRRTAEDLNWRYVQCPDKGFRLLQAESVGAVKGYAVLKVEGENKRKIGYIYDFLALHEKATVSVLLRRVIQLFLKERVEEVRCLMLPHTYFYPFFKQAGFSEGLHGALHMVGECYQDTKDLAFSFFDIRHWFVTLGDSDR